MEIQSSVCCYEKVNPFRFAGGNIILLKYMLDKLKSMVDLQIAKASKYGKYCCL